MLGDGKGRFQTKNVGACRLVSSFVLVNTEI